MIPPGKVTKTQLNITNKSQEDSPFRAGDHKANKTNIELYQLIFICVV